MDYCASSKHQLAPTESWSAGRRTRAIVLTFFKGIFPDAFQESSQAHQTLSPETTQVNMFRLSATH